MRNLRLPRLLAAALSLAPLVLSAALSFGQAPPPVPALPDSERRTQYSISASTCACSVGFALFGTGSDVDQWLEVWVAGTRYLSTDPSHGWALTSATGTLATIPRPITDAVLTFTAVQTGTVQIVGAERPRRTAQFAENRGVAARDLNQALTDLVAQNRETWDKINDVTGRGFFAPPGSTGGIITSPLFGVISSLGPFVTGDGACWNGSTGTSLKDCGWSPGQQFVITSAPYGAVSGADTGGVNSTAIAAAIAACASAGGGTIVIPTGNFQFATGLSNTTGGCNFAGYGKQSILTYTGTGVGITTSGNIDNVFFRDMQIASGSATNTLVKVSSFNNNMMLDRVLFTGGGVQLTLSSAGSGAGGSYSVTCLGSEFNGAALKGINIAPNDNGFSNAHSIIGCTFFGFSQYAIWDSGGFGLRVSNSRIERHLGAGATTSAVHVDSLIGVSFDSMWLEDDSNNFLFDIGNNVSAFSISHSFADLNAAGGTQTSAGMLKVNGTGCQNITIEDVHASIGGTIGNVWDTGSCPVYGRAASFDSGTAAWGFASTASAANVDIDFTVNSSAAPTTFTSGTQQVGVARVAANRSISATAPVTGGGDLSANRTIACATCATTTNGGALSGTAPISVSAGGAISIDTTAWSAYTPTLTCGTATFGSVTARSKTLGKTTWAQIEFTITAIGTCTTPITFTLPNTAQSSGAIVGYEDVTANNGVFCKVAASSATATCIKNALVAFGVNNHVIASGVYENQ